MLLPHQAFMRVVRIYEWDATQGAPSADLPEWMIAASPSKAKTGLDGGPRVTAADLNAL